MQDLGERRGDLVEADRTTTPPDLAGDARYRSSAIEAGRSRRSAAPACRGRGRSRAAFRRFRGPRPRFQPLDRGAARAAASPQLVSRLEAALADGRARCADARARRGARCASDPTHEGACRAAMQAHLALGDTAQAMRLYERLWQVLDEELDVEPSEKTQGALCRDQAGPARPGGRRRAGRRRPICSRRSRSSSSPRRRRPAWLLRLFRPDLPRRDDRGAVAVPRLAGGRRRPSGSTSPPAYRAYSLRITLHGRDDSDPRRRCGWSTRRTGQLHLGRALRGDAGQRCPACTARRCATSRWR